MKARRNALCRDPEEEDTEVLAVREEDREEAVLAVDREDREAVSAAVPMGVDLADLRQEEEEAGTVRLHHIEDIEADVSDAVSPSCRSLPLSLPPSLLSYKMLLPSFGAAFFYIFSNRNKISIKNLNKIPLFCLQMNFSVL